MKDGIIYFLTEEEGERKSLPTDTIYYPTTSVNGKHWSIVIFFERPLQKDEYAALCKVTFRMDWAPFDILEQLKEISVYEGSKIVAKIVFDW